MNVGGGSCGCWWRYLWMLVAVVVDVGGGSCGCWWR